MHAQAQLRVPSWVFDCRQGVIFFWRNCWYNDFFEHASKSICFQTWWAKAVLEMIGCLLASQFSKYWTPAFLNLQCFLILLCFQNILHWTTVSVLVEHPWVGSCFPTSYIIYHFANFQKGIETNITLYTILRSVVTSAAHHYPPLSKFLQ